jgi:hypothetical protein
MSKEILWILTMLLSHYIDDVESIDSVNTDQHECLCPELVLHLLRHILSRYAPFRRLMKFQSESALVPSHKSFKFAFLMILENGKQPSVSFHPNLS